MTLHLSLPKTAKPRRDRLAAYFGLSRSVIDRQVYTVGLAALEAQAELQRLRREEADQAAARQRLLELTRLEPAAVEAVLSGARMAG